MCFSTARSVRNSDVGDRRVVLALRHVRQDLALAVGELRERRVRHPVLRRDQRLDDLRVEDRAAARDLVQRADQLVDVGDPFLQQVAEPAGAVLQQVVGVVLLDELREHDDADLRMARADLLGRLDPFVRARGGHADVGQDGVGGVLLDGGEQLVAGGRRADELDLIGGGQERGCTLADQVVILGEHHADHARMVHGGLEGTGYAA